MHLEQIYTGFGLLERRGLINLRMERAPGYSAAIYSTSILSADVESYAGAFRMGFDLQDRPEVWSTLLDDTQFIFKRTYEPRVVSAHPERERIFPLGLNFPVLSRAGYGVRRAMWGGSARTVATGLIRQSGWLSALAGTRLSIATSSTARLEGLPVASADPVVLFVARVWDPERVPADGRRQERVVINEVRAACVRALRTAFGKRFVGGLEHTPYAVTNYPDCLVPAARTTHKAHYLSLLHQSSIGVATSGLEGSVGWKLAEYVAASKAIVTEPLGIELPGTFSSPANYLEFTTPDQCVEQVGALVDSPELRLAMMQQNMAYYHAFVRPDALVWNAIGISLAKASAQPSA